MATAGKYSLDQFTRLPASGAEEDKTIYLKGVCIKFKKEIIEVVTFKL